MRKFVAQHSAGLRVRVNPSLQSEQVGVIKPNGVISFIDEVSSHSKLVIYRISRCLAQPEYSDLLWLCLCVTDPQ